jgi:hypothetical protein
MLPLPSPLIEAVREHEATAFGEILAECFFIPQRLMLHIDKAVFLSRWAVSRKSMVWPSFAHWAFLMFPKGSLQWRRKFLTPAVEVRPDFDSR